MAGITRGNAKLLSSRTTTPLARPGQGAASARNAKRRRIGRVLRRLSLGLRKPDVTACIWWLKNRLPAEWRDRREEHHTVVLAPVYGWFTEGFDTRDLKEAKAALATSVRFHRQHD
jgi:hypothetical protein